MTTTHFGCCERHGIVQSWVREMIPAAPVCQMIDADANGIPCGLPLGVSVPPQQT